MPFQHWSPEMREALTALAPRNRRRTTAGTSKGVRSGANILGALAHHPALARAFFALKGHLLLGHHPDRATARAGHHAHRDCLAHSAYEWVQHVFVARDAGLSDLELGLDHMGPRRACLDRVRAGPAARGRRPRPATASSADHTWTVLTTHLDHSRNPRSDLHRRRLRNAGMDGGIARHRARRRSS